MSEQGEVPTVNKIIVAEQNKVKIAYFHVEREDNLDRLHRMLERYSFLFPRWLNMLSITIYDDPPEGIEGAEAKSNVSSQAYGYASVDIYSKFFDRTDERQCEIMVHELVHIAHGKLLLFDREHVIRYVREHNEDLGNYLFEQHKDIVEEFVENMAQMIVENMRADR